MKSTAKLDREADLRAEYRDEQLASYDEYAEFEALDNPNDRLSPRERRP